MRHDTLPPPAPPTAPTTADPARPPRSKQLTLLVIAGTGLMLILDLTITNVALPTIQHALRMTPQELGWVVNAYALGYGGFLLLGGRAGSAVVGAVGGAGGGSVSCRIGDPSLQVDIHPQELHTMCMM